MLFYVQMRWNYVGRLTLDQLWDKEYEETQHAQDKPGMVVGIYKVAAQPRVIVIVNVSSIEELDRTVYRLPMAEYLEFEQVWALRDYEGFTEDVKKHYKP